MAELRLKVAPKQKKFVNDAQVAWEELEEALWSMCMAVGMDESTAGDMLAEMKIQVEAVWSAYEGVGVGA